MVFDFFKKLAEQRVQQAQAQAKAKVMGVQAKAKAKAAGGFNSAVKGAQDKGKAAVGGKAKKDKDGKEGGGMGWFGKKGDGDDQVASEPEAAFGDKTQFIQIAPEKPRECVGWVVILSGTGKGQDFRLVTGKNVMGTAADCDIVLPDKYMSSRHAVLRHEEGTFVLVDLDSTNGTFVNDRRVSKEELIDNDRVRLGRTELKFKSLY
jgi:hypothetical protein